jgi:hypothetical protein
MEENDEPFKTLVNDILEFLAGGFLYLPEDF